MNISVVIPTKNENPASVLRLVERVAKVLGRHYYETLIVDASDDNGAGILDALSHARLSAGCQFVERQESPGGPGTAYRQGFRHTHGNYILMLEGDGEADPEIAGRMADVAASFDVGLVVAARQEFVGYDPVKLVLNRGFQYLFRTLLGGTSISDLTFTYKLIRRDVLDSLPLQADYQDIGAETTMLPLAMGVKALQVPTVWIARRKSGGASLNLWGNMRYVKVGLRAVWHKWSRVVYDVTRKVPSNEA